MGHCWRMMLRNLEHTNPVQLFNYSKPLWDVIGHYWGIIGHYWELRDIIGTLFGHYLGIIWTLWGKPGTYKPCSVVHLQQTIMGFGFTIA